MHRQLDHPSELMETKTARKEIKNTYVDWLVNFDPPWMVFGSLTFKDEIYPEVAISKFYKLLQMLNKDLFGKHYTNIVGHSYFSYMFCHEYQIREVIHFHFLTNRPINFVLAKNYWYQIAGISKLTKIKNLEKSLRYCLKYVTKENDPTIYKAKKIYEPNQYPLWWIEALSNSTNGNELIINP